MYKHRLFSTLLAHSIKREVTQFARALIDLCDQLEEMKDSGSVTSTVDCVLSGNSILLKISPCGPKTDANAFEFSGLRIQPAPIDQQHLCKQLVCGTQVFDPSI